MPANNIVLIENEYKNPKILGMGLFFLKYVFTCHHIFFTGISSGIPLSEGYIVRLPLVDNAEKLTAKIIYSSSEEDLVILEVNEESVNDHLISTQNVDLWGHKFRAFGFPNGYDSGVWSSGEILGAQSMGWLQLETTKVTGHQIAKGFSGSPVWDETIEAFVGVIVAADNNKDTRVGYMIPCQKYFNILSKLNKPSITKENNFFGRQVETHLLDTLIKDSSNFVVTITGIGGIGKTALIKEYSRTQNYNFVWISAADISEFNLEKMSFSYWAQMGSREFNASSLEYMAGHIKKSKNIIVLDNFETINHDQAERVALFIRNLWEPGIKSKFVITSRVPVKDLDDWIYSKELQITKGLDYESAEKFVFHLAHKKNIGYLENRILLDVINVTGGHPKILEVILGIVKRKGRIDVKKLIEKKDGELAYGLDKILGSSYLLLSQEQLQTVYYFHFFGTHNFYENEVKALTQYQNNDEILDRLVDLGLINFDFQSKIYSVHQLIFDYSFSDARKFVLNEHILLDRLYNYYDAQLQQDDKELNYLEVNNENLLALIERLLKNKDLRDSGRLIVNTCYRLEKIGQFSRALYILRNSLSVAEEVNDSKSKRAFNFLIGRVAYLVSDMLMSQNAFMEFHKLSEEEVSFRHAFALHHLAISKYYPRSTSGEMIFYYLRKSLVLYNKLNLKLYLAYALNDLASQYYYYKDKTLAVKWTELSLKILEAISLDSNEDKKIAGIIYRATSILFRNSGDFEKAQEFILASIHLLEEAGSYWELGHSLDSYSQVLLKLGKQDLAISVIKKLIDLSTMIGKSGQIALAYYTLGNIYVKQQQFDLAHEEYKKGYDLALDIDSTDLSLLYIGNYVIGRLYLNQNKLEDAIAHLQKSIDLRITSNQLTSLPQVYLLLAQCYYNKTDFEKAKEALESLFRQNEKSIDPSKIELSIKANDLMQKIREKQKST